MTDEVQEDSVVQVHYIGSFPDTEEVFDTSRVEIAKKQDVFNENRDYAPLEVTMGQNQVIPGFEKNLLGMKVGDRKVVDLQVADAYGEPRDELVVSVPADQFTQAQVEPEVGMMIQTSNGIAQITAYDSGEKMVTLDFNHPLAGKPLRFDLEVVGIN